MNKNIAAPFERIQQYWILSHGKRKKSIRELVKELFFGVSITPTNVSKDSSEFTFIISRLRSDYLQLFGAMYDACAQSKRFIVVKECRKLRFPPIRMLFSCGELFHRCATTRIPTNEQNGTLEYELRRLSLLEQTCLYFYCINMRIACSKLIAQGVLDTKKLVCLCDAWPLENLLIEAANQRGIETISCQHGLFIDALSINSADKLDYTNIPSKIFLAWGENTKQLVQKYNADLDVYVLGNPILDEDRTQCQKPQGNLIMLVLDIPIKSEYNQKMIDVVCEFAKEYHWKVQIRKHPQDKKCNYRFDSVVAQYGHGTDANLTIGHTSSMIVTNLRRGIPTLKFESNCPCFQLDDAFLFQNAEQLKVHAKDCTADIYCTEGKKFIEFIGEESKQKYAVFLRSR